MFFAFGNLTGPLENGSLLAALSHFYPFASAISVMLVTYVRLKTTNGRSCMSWYVAFLIVFGVVPGILGASKEGMLTPIFCWFVTAAAMRYRFSWQGTVCLIGVLFLTWIFVYPYSQRARFPIRDAPTLAEKVDLILLFIREPSTFPDIPWGADELSEYGASSSNVNILARYSLLRSNDMLIDGDQRAGYTPIERYIPALYAMVPHMLWPDRPTTITSNELGHKAGFMMGENDTETGIALGSPALFFDIGGWLALIVYTLLIFTLFFFGTIRAVGTTESGVWGLVPIGAEAHIAGAASPSAVLDMLMMFLGVFFVTVAILKSVSYISERLVSRRITA
jgi:hypothetical protein